MQWTSASKPSNDINNSALFKFLFCLLFRFPSTSNQRQILFYNFYIAKSSEWVTFLLAALEFKIIHSSVMCHNVISAIGWSSAELQKIAGAAGVL